MSIYSPTGGCCNSSVKSLVHQASWGQKWLSHVRCYQHCSCWVKDMVEDFSTMHTPPSQLCRPLLPTSHGCQSPPGWHRHGIPCPGCSLRAKGARSGLGGRGHQQRRWTTVTETTLCPPCSSFSEDVGWFPTRSTTSCWEDGALIPQGVKKTASVFHSQSTIFCNTYFPDWGNELASLSKNLNWILPHTQNTHTILPV